MLLLCALVDVTMCGVVVVVAWLCEHGLLWWDCTYH